MKKLVFSVLVAGVMVAFGAEETTAKPAAPATVAAPVKRQITPEQRAEMRAKFEQRMAARKAEMEKKSLEIIKKYGLDDEKAKALLAELEAAMKPSRRPRPNMMKRPVAKPAAAPAKAE